MTEEVLSRPEKSYSTGKTTRAARPAPKRRRRPLWLNALIVFICLVVISACVFWVTAFKFYNVVSNSMAPTFRGGEYERDRLLCWMLPFPGREPRRWEIVLFDTPEVGRDQEVMPGFNTGGQRGITVKRAVGVADERLAIAGGDIWTHPLAGGRYTRRIKPDLVQRALWISVYREDFQDINLDEFGHHWLQEGTGRFELGGDRVLSIAPDGARCGMVYKPVIRTGGNGGKLLEVLPGIPDRYVLEQEVLFHCKTPNCGNAFGVLVDNQKIQGRCPVCRTMNFEDSVTFYGFRSGLAEIGPYAVGLVPQGDGLHNRANSYYFVPDLRVRLNMRLAGNASTCAVSLRTDDWEDVLRVSADRIEINGVPLADAPAVQPGVWTSLEFYRVDGALRLFLNADGKRPQPLFDHVMHNTPKPEVQETGQISGLTIFAEGGGVDIRDIAVDRDIYYFSGSEHAYSSYLSGMESTGEVNIPQGAFFPMGDNTTVSLDARSWGPIEQSLLKGTAIRIWRPEERAGAIPLPEE